MRTWGSRGGSRPLRVSLGSFTREFDLGMSQSEAFKRAYRDTIGLFATGVTVLLAQKDGLVLGMTANALASLSLEPVRLVVCPAKSAPFSGVLERGSVFTVNILGEHQQAHSELFANDQAPLDAGSRHADPEFELLEWAEAGGAPRLSDCVAALACRVEGLVDGGDHWIVVGDVTTLYRSHSDRAPLLYFAGSYGAPWLKDR